MDNKLIPTNTIWHKIRKFFQMIFPKEKTYNINEGIIGKNDKTNNNLNTRFEREKQNQKLAEKLLLGELSASELNETEVNEMTEYFTKDIQNIDNELLRIKQHILAIKQELQL